MKWNLFVMPLCISAVLTARTVCAGEEKEKTKGQSQKSELQASTQTTTYVRVSELVGAEVSDRDGEAVGEIKDVILNPTSGTVESALLDTESSDKLLSVPWQAVKVQDEDECVLNCQCQRLEAVPTLEGGQHTSVRQPDYAVRIHREESLPQN